MDNQLQSISKIFTEKLFRIPDYQRGYAWIEKQLKDYWNDIIQLEEGKNHYVGVLTLEKVPEEVYKKWDDDKWIITSKSYEPYYVVDGQQRLTTTIILIQTITEIVNKKNKLNYTTIDEIKKRYIFDSKDEGVSRSYIFGYEKDNPSYEYLKTRIFLEDSSSSYINEETIYTHNLDFAKSFFLDNLKKLKKTEIEVIYRKITQNLLFNIYSISSDIDVFIAFETMNNRGKPLSNLELLKNRLIYLSTKFAVDSTEKNQLRKNINNTWKAVYHYLGKNKDKPLADDVFLLNHFIAYFGNTFIKDEDLDYIGYRTSHNWLRENYINYLLEQKFTVKNIITNESSKKLKVSDINNYILSLQHSVEIWFNLFNPISCNQYSDEEKEWLDKIYRLGLLHFAPLLLTFYLSKPKKEIIIPFLKALESYGFTNVFYNYRPVNARLFDINYLSHKLVLKKINIQDVISHLNRREQEIRNSPYFLEEVSSKYRSDGFYDWPGIRYFLFEYDLSLKGSAKTKRVKINWNEYRSSSEDYITIEHIFPQTPNKDCWKKNFGSFTKKQQRVLANSLGNLLPLSKPKNSSLQNKCFVEKVENDTNQVGYRYGSYSENEIAKKTDWTPRDILDRGLKLLKFMEKRWDIDFGGDDNRINILGLKFLVDPLNEKATSKRSSNTSTVMKKAAKA